MEERAMRTEVRFAAVAVLVTMAGAAQAAPIQVQVNGERVNFPYAQPAQVAGRVMIPLRGVLERLGADRIDWRPARQEVLVSAAGRDLRLKIGDRNAEVNGRDVSLDVPPMMGIGIRNPNSARLGMVCMTLAKPSTQVRKPGFRVSKMPAGMPIAIATASACASAQRSRSTRRPSSASSW